MYVNVILNHCPYEDKSSETLSDSVKCSEALRTSHTGRQSCITSKLMYLIGTDSGKKENILGVRVVLIRIFKIRNN